MDSLFSHRSVTRWGLAAAIAVLLAILLPACTPALDWREYRFDAGGFAVMFPQKPGRAEKKLATPAGEVTMKMVSVQSGETVFGAASAEFDAPPDLATQDAMRDALLKNFAGNVIVDQPVNAGALLGREVIKRGNSAAGDVELRARFFVRGKRYYQIAAAGRQGAVQEADLDLFLTSFKPD